MRAAQTDATMRLGRSPATGPDHRRAATAGISPRGVAGLAGVRRLAAAHSRLGDNAAAAGYALRGGFLKARRRSARASGRSHGYPRRLGLAAAPPPCDGVDDVRWMAAGGGGAAPSHCNQSKASCSKWESHLRRSGPRLRARFEPG